MPHVKKVQSLENAALTTWYYHKEVMRRWLAGGSFSRCAVFILCDMHSLMPVGFSHVILMLLSMIMNDVLPGFFVVVVAAVVIKCFMIGVNVWWVYLAPQNIPRAISVGNKVVLYCIVCCAVSASEQTRSLRYCRMRCCTRKYALRVPFWISTEVVHLWLATGVELAQWFRAPDSWSKGREFESRRENFLLQSQLYVLILISASVPPPCYRSSTQKIPVILPKVPVAGYSYTRRHPTGVAWNEVTLYTGAWLYGVHRTCAETAAVLRGISYVITK